MSQLAPITDEILRYVHQLELDDILEDEFYSKLESIANHTRRSKKQPRCAPGNRYVAQKENWILLVIQGGSLETSVGRLSLPKNLALNLLTL